MRCVILGINNPSNSLDQNNSIHSVDKLPSWRYYIPYRFCLGNVIPLQEPMVFVKNPKYGIPFLLSFGMVMQYLSKIF
jgi:hypothetical protein